jgi:hypothetical protein
MEEDLNHVPDIDPLYVVVEELQSACLALQKASKLVSASGSFALL